MSPEFGRIMSMAINTVGSAIGTINTVDTVDTIRDSHVELTEIQTWGNPGRPRERAQKYCGGASKFKTMLANQGRATTDFVEPRSLKLPR